MPPSAFWQAIRNSYSLHGRLNKLFFVKLSGVLFLVILICIQLGPLLGPSVSAQITTLNHTTATVDESCHQVAFSSDGNPFPLCPGPLPKGGNCTWWGWEMWHLLGYDLPLNWGNAADWISDAERSGLPVGTTPRVGSIAVFPLADGVWAFGTAGHVAFITSVSADGSTFNVTYQNYGDPTLMHIGIGYPVSLINEPHFQNGNLRFIYFPRLIDPRLFTRLPGIDGNDLSGITSANYQWSIFNSFDTGSSRSSSNTDNQFALSLPPDQQFNADFTGSGPGDLLLYNRRQGTLKVLSLSDGPKRLNILHLPRFAQNEILADQSDTAASTPQLVSLSDKTTPANGWGSSLDIRVGDFAGTGRTDILLYDRVTGKLQLLSLTPQLTIQKHVTLSGWGPGWELYVGSFDGQHSSLFMYNRQVNTMPVQSLNPTVIPTFPTGSTPSPGPTRTLSPTPKPSPTSDPSPTPKPSPTPDPSSTPRPSPTPDPSSTPCPTSTPASAEDLTSMLKRCTTPTPTSVQMIGSGQSLDPQTILHPAGPDQTLPLDNDLSSKLGAFMPSALASNVMLMDFDRNFNVRHFQQYTLIDNAWEVYVGHFVSAHQDGLLLYDRMLGEVHLLSFDSNLNVSHNQPVQSIAANWEVYSGDFMGSGRSQVLLYDPTNGSAEMLVLKSDLSPAYIRNYSGWGTNQVLYVGHFGASTLSIMLYDAQRARSTFLEFDHRLAVMHQVTTHSWSNRWQILIGSFLDRSRCLVAHNCSTGDDILVLDRKTGQLEQFTFAFGNQYHVYDNRAQAFERTQGIPATDSLTSIDTSAFSLLSTLNTSIRGEELY